MFMFLTSHRKSSAADKERFGSCQNHAELRQPLGNSHPGAMWNVELLGGSSHDEVSACLITMVSFHPVSRIVPLPNGRTRGL